MTKTKRSPSRKKKKVTKIKRRKVRVVMMHLRKRIAKTKSNEKEGVYRN